MKFTKRITSILLIFVFAFTSMYMVAPAADFSDVAGDYAHYEAITALVDQGIINGYEDGTFKPENTITRAEFSKLLAVSSAPSGYTFSATTTTFPDIADMNAAHGWAVPYISYAVSTKAINGYTDGTFQPGNNVTYGEAIKMIVCTLGYAPVVDTTLTPWYQGYLNIANQIGLTKNAIASGDAPANRGIVAHLIYNMLDCPVLVQTGLDALGNPIYSTGTGEGSSFGDSKDNAKSDEGVVMGVTDYSLDATAVGRNRVQIDNEIFTLGGNLSMDTVKSYIGCRVSYSYTGTGSKQEVTKITRLNGSNSSVKIEPWQISNITSSYIEYYADENAEIKNVATKVTFGSKPYVIYNGVPVKPADVGAGFDVTTYFNIETGSLTLFSNDSNEKTAELVIVESYKTYFVNSPSTSNGITTIYDKNQAYTGFGALNLDEEDVTSVTKVNSKGGKPSSSSLSAIANKSVVSVAVPYGTTEGTSVIISSAYVTGDVNEFSSDYEHIVIGTAEYELAPYYRTLLDNSCPDAGFANGDNAKFYLDHLGRIVFTEKNESSDPYGLIVAYAQGSGLGSTNAVKLLTTGGKYLGEDKGYALKETMTIIDENGQKSTKTSNEVIEYLKNKATVSSIGENGGTVVLPVRYKTSGKMFTSFEILAPQKTRGTYKYSSSGYSFSGNGTTFNAASSGTNATTFFVVPADIANYDGYVKKPLSFFSNNSNYNVAAYDLVGTTAKLVVCYFADTTARVNPSTPVYLIESVNDARNSEGQTVKKITYQKVGDDIITSPERPSILTSDKSDVIAAAASLKSGDLVKFATENGEVTVIKTVFTNGTTLTDETGTVKIADHHIQKDDTSGDGYYQVVYGTANSIDTDILTIIPEFYDPVANSALDETPISLTTNNPKYYKYSAKNAEFTTTTPDAVMKYLNFKEADPAKASRIVAIVMNKKVVGVYILGE